VFKVNVAYDPDTLTNNEIGWKTQWLDHRLQFNGAVYQEDWKKRSDLALRSRRVRQSRVHHEWTELPRQGVETEFCRTGDQRLTLTTSAAVGTAAHWSTSPDSSERTVSRYPKTPMEPKAPRWPWRRRSRAISVQDTKFPSGTTAFVQVARHAPGPLLRDLRIGSAGPAGQLHRLRPARLLDHGCLHGHLKDAWSVQLYGQN